MSNKNIWQNSHIRNVIWQRNQILILLIDKNNIYNLQVSLETSIERYFPNHNIVLFKIFINDSLESYEIFLINNQINHKSLHKSPTNIIVPFHLLIARLHKYHIIMVKMHFQMHSGFFKKNFQISYLESTFTKFKPHNLISEL